MYPYIEIFGHKIPTYGTMIGIGFLLCIAITLLYLLKYRTNIIPLVILILLTCLSGAVMYLSAAFFDALWHNLDTWRETGTFTWKWWGITFSGGLLGGLLFYVIAYWFIFSFISKIKRYNNERYKLTYYLNFIIVGVVLAHAFGRVGCYFGGCCYGRETTSWLGVNYPIETYFDGTQLFKVVYPTQLFEAGFLFILFVVLFFFVRKNQLRVYLISYGIFRFILEFFRGDSRGATIFGVMSPSQLISVIMVIVGVLLIFFEDKLIYLVKKKCNPELLSIDAK